MLVVKQIYTCDECGKAENVERHHDVKGDVLKMISPPFDWWTNNLSHFCHDCTKKMFAKWSEREAAKCS